MDIDLKKLVDQDPEFQNFMKEVIFIMFMDEGASNDMIRAMYPFYSSGQSPEFVVQWIRTMNILKDGS